MKIICLNGWGGKLHRELIEYLQTEDPDVLCLQEVVHTPLSDQDWLTYRDGDHILPQRANFFADVCNALPKHMATFCPAAQGVLWNDNASIPSQWGLATFVRKSYPVVGQVQDFVHKDFSPNGYGEHPRSRSAHAIRIYDHASEKPVCITHMHGLRDLNGKKDTPERHLQAKRLFQISQSIRKPNDLQIICGDFNVEPDSETLSLFKNAGFTELVTHNGFNSTRSSHYKKPGKFADYMLVGDLNAVKSFQVIDKPEVSDHCPLVLDI